jgi:hypothetical protein
MKQAFRGTVERRAVLVGAGGLLLSGCAGGGASSGGNGSDPSRGTAVIGLRIGDGKPRRPPPDDSILSVFKPKVRGPSVEITFGLVEPDTGNIDLPILPGYSGKMAQLKTGDEGTAYEAIDLIAGRYASIQAYFFTGARVIYNVRFSDGGNRAIAADEIGGYGFTVNPGEVVYVGTVVFPPHGTGQLRIENEFDAAAAAHPRLAAVGRDRGTRIMESIGRPKSRGK